MYRERVRPRRERAGERPCSRVAAGAKSEVSSKEKEGNIDVVEKSIGVFGKWHLFICLSIFLAKFPVAFHQLNIVFIAPPVKFTCIDNSTDQCSAKCPEHIFDRSIFEETIITEWDLVCNKSYLASLAQTITMTGILFGNMIFGYLSDRFGRRKPLLYAVVLQLVAGCVSAFPPWLPLYFALRFLTAFATGGTMTISFVMIMEYVGTKWRTTLGILYQIPFNIGHLMLVLIAYYVREWRLYQLVISIPSVIFLAYYWILPESPKWLLIVGRREEAEEVMKKIASFNNLPTTNIKEDIDKYYSENDSKNEIKKGGTALDLLRTPIMRIYTIIMWMNWLVCGFCFFGAAQFAGQLSGDIFINVVISAVMQAPGNLICIWLLKILGRKYTFILSNIIAGVFCLIIGFVPSDPTWIKALFSCLSQTAFMIAFTTIYIYAGELFPTTVRNVGIGTSSTFARLGSIIAPFVVGLITVKEWLPPVIFGVTPIVVSLLTFKLPDTKDCQLPDTVEQAEEFARTEQRKKSQQNVKHEGYENQTKI